jgi:hypothetical protein
MNSPTGQCLLVFSLLPFYREMLDVSFLEVTNYVTFTMLPFRIGLSYANVVGTSHADGVCAMCKQALPRSQNNIYLVYLCGFSVMLLIQCVNNTHPNE